MDHFSKAPKGYIVNLALSQRPAARRGPSRAPRARTGTAQALALCGALTPADLFRLSIGHTDPTARRFDPMTAPVPPAKCAPCPFHDAPPPVPPLDAAHRASRGPSSVAAIRRRADGRRDRRWMLAVPSSPPAVRPLNAMIRRGRLALDGAGERLKIRAPGGPRASSMPG